MSDLGVDPAHDPSRRRFLSGAVVGSLVTTGMAVVPFGRAAAALSPATSAATSNRTLVVVFLRGGPDGASLVVPAGDPEYRDLRPTIAVPESRLLPVDDRFGLHPAFAPIAEVWDRGEVAVVPACGSVRSTRSHFEQQAEIESGGGVDGWLARVVRQLPGTPGEGAPSFAATAMGGRVPRSLTGAPEVVAVDGLDESLTVPFTGLDDDAALRALDALTAHDHPLVAAGARTALAALPVLRSVVDEGDVSGAGPTDEGLGARRDRSAVSAFVDLAALVRADIGVRVATVDLGGWDTHDDMGDVDGGRMTDLVGSLAEGLAAFAEALGPALETTTVLAMGEFGRRVAENGSGGTDHGRGGALLAMGGGVRGGRHGDWPGLAADVLDRGDVPVATDWRIVAAEMTERLGVTDVGAVFPDLGPERLGILY